MAGCCKQFFKILTIILALVDIGIGWYWFYDIYHEVWHLEHDDPDDITSDCPNPKIYWIIYIPFESIGTILACIEIYYLIKELKKDKSLFNECFSRAWFLVVAIYIFALFPTSILDIIFRSKCICGSGFSVEELWRDEVRDFMRGFVGGVSVLFLTILVHIAEFYSRIRRLCKLIKSCLFCMRLVPDDDEVKKPLPCFIISALLFFGYLAVFVTEIVYIFCKRRE